MGYLPKGLYWPQSTRMPLTIRMCEPIIFCLSYCQCDCNDLEQAGELPNGYHTGSWGGAGCFKYYSIISMEILRRDFKLLPYVARIKHSQAVLEIYNVLPPGFKSTLMRIADRLQVLDRL